MNSPDVKIKLIAIELLSKMMFQRPDKGFFGEDFNFNINVETKVNPAQKIILNNVSVKINEINKEEIIGSISVGIAFSIENFEEVIIEKDKNIYHIPPEIDAILKSMSVSTTRGVMFSEFTGTYLYKAILPILLFSPPQEEKIAELVNVKKGKKSD